MVHKVKKTAASIKNDREAAARTREELQNNIKMMHEVYAVQSEALAASNRELAEAVRLLAEEKRTESRLSVESLAAALDANIGRIEMLCANFEEMGKSLESSYQKLSDFIKAHKPELSAINKLAGEAAQLRSALTTHTTPAETAAIERINSICTVLEQNVSGTWTNINDTLTRNAQELFETYERFFEICNVISKNDDEGWPEK